MPCGCRACFNSRKVLKHAKLRLRACFLNTFVIGRAQKGGHSLLDRRECCDPSPQPDFSHYVIVRTTYGSGVYFFTAVRILCRSGSGTRQANSVSMPATTSPAKDLTCQSPGPNVFARSLVVSQKLLRHRAVVCRSACRSGCWLPSRREVPSRLMACFTVVARSRNAG